MDITTTIGYTTAEVVLQTLFKQNHVRKHV